MAEAYFLNKDFKVLFKRFTDIKIKKFTRDRKRDFIGDSIFSID